MKTSFEKKENLFSLSPTPWNERSLDLVYKRYLNNTNISAEEWFSLTAKRVCQQYKGEEQEYYQRLYTALLQSKAFLPTSAALANSVKNNSAFAGCMVMPLPDSVSEVFEKILPEMMRMLLLGVGIGIDLSHCTPRLLDKDGRISLGPIQHLLTVTQAVERPAIYQGLKRAAFMATLYAQHPDIFEFITLKKEQSLSTTNISVSVDAIFTTALNENGLLPLKWQNDTTELLTIHHLETMKINAQRRGVKGPDLNIDGEGRVFSHSYENYVGRVLNDIIFVEAKTIFSCIAESAYICGDPGIINLDAINRDNPTHSRYSEEQLPGTGAIKTTTPCAEQALLPYEVCHLGSFNLGLFVQNNKFQKELFSEAVHLATRFMDDLITITDNGLSESTRVSMANRKLGLGIMGLADALAELEIPYDSTEALSFAHEIGGLFQKLCEDASYELALERGSYPNFNYSKHKNGRARRNATLTTIAPTGHIATLADCSFGIEPYYLLHFQRQGSDVYHCSILDKKLQSIEYSLKQWIRDTKKINAEYRFEGTLSTLVERPFSDKDKNNYLKKMKKVFKTAHEMTYNAHLNMVFAWQKYIDTGISKTINLPHDTTVDEVADIFSHSLLLNLKGITIFRDASLPHQSLSKPQACEECIIPMDNEHDAVFA